MRRLILILTLLLAGCATSPIMYARLTPPPARARWTADDRLACYREAQGGGDARSAGSAYVVGAHPAINTGGLLLTGVSGILIAEIEDARRRPADPVVFERCLRALGYDVRWP